MGNSIEVIYGAIYRVNDPLHGSILIACNSLLAIEAVIWKGAEKVLCNQILRLAIQSQLHIMMLSFINFLREMKIGLEKITCAAGGSLGRLKWCHTGDGNL
tara:strand:- start:5520 stop:5822 length:303 start_codon:yes stop_codon:yes gene_type:complete